MDNLNLCSNGDLFHLWDLKIVSQLSQTFRADYVSDAANDT